jgi:four helix bundle protein
MVPKPPTEIRERTFQFACAIVRFCSAMSAVPGPSRVVALQLLDAGTSIGANLEEAKAAYSRREFISKNSIALKEARETLYWLRIINSCSLADSHECLPLLDEANQLVAILTATVKTARARLLTKLAILLTSSLLLLTFLLLFHLSDTGSG